MRLAEGARLGSYEILSALGAGGMGEVYRARDTQLDREVAIKVLPQTFVADTTAGNFSTMRRMDGSWRCPSRGRRRSKSPDPLFTARLLGGPAAVAGFRAQYDVSAKGQRFLLNVPVDETPEFTAITVVLHWTAGLRK
jgi:serine/threonine protein kinase